MASLNTAQIMDAARRVWGRSISDPEAQTIMNATRGGDPGSVENYLQNDPRFLVDRQAKESAALTTQQQARENEFLGRVQGIPEALRGIETELGLPQARETFQAAGETTRNVAGQIRGIAPTQQTIAKQVGISAPRLQQRIGAETAKLQPTVETATRGLEEAQAGLSGLLGSFQTRAANVLAPYQIEAGVLGDSVKNAFDVWKTNTQTALDRELATLQEKGLSDRSALDRANQLAIAESAATKGSFQDLGNRVVLVDPSTGQVISSFAKGLTPSSASSGSGNISGYLNTPSSSLNTLQPGRYSFLS